jgi:hypothetical protein
LEPAKAETSAWERELRRSARAGIKFTMVMLIRRKTRVSEAWRT